MGDARYTPYYSRIIDAEDRVREIRSMSDEEVILALAAASREKDPYVANVLAVEAVNRARRTSAITENLGEGVLTVDDEGRVGFLNPAAERMLGWTLADVAGKDAHSLLHADCEPAADGPCDLVDVLAPDPTAAEAATLVHREDDEFARRDGGIVPVAFTASPLVHEEVTQGAVVVFRDVTERRRAEAMRAHLAAVVASSQDAVVSKTPEGIITSWNPAAERLYGYTAEEAVGQSAVVLVPEHLRTEEEGVLRLVARGARVEHYDTERLTKDGRVIEVSVSRAPVKDASGRVVGISSISYDVTERRRAERALAESEHRYRILAENATDVIMLLTPKLVCTYASPASLSVLGFDPDDLVGKRALDLVHPHDADVVRAEKATLFGSTDPVTVAYRARRKDGSVTWLETTARAVRDDATGEVREVIAVSRDVTKRKKAEGMFRDLLESAPDAMVIAGEDGRIVIANAEAERTFGYPREELVGEPIETLMPERFRGRHVGHRRGFAVHGSGRPMGMGLELRGRRKDGSEFPIEVSLSPMRTEDGGLIIAAVRDVTDREKARAELARVKRENELIILNAAGEGIVGVDSEGRVTFVNAVAARALGAPVEALIGGAVHDVLRRGAGDEEPAGCPVCATLADGGVHESRDDVLLRPDGSALRVDYLATPIEEPGGRGGAVVMFRVGSPATRAR